MNDFLLRAFLGLDAVLIAPFRLLDDSRAGFACGILATALGAALLGRACAAAVDRVQRTKRTRQEAEINRHQDTSFSALAVKDRETYLAANHLAQEAYGNAMALAAGRAAALIWPALMVLAWSTWRFSGVPLPLVGESAGPAVFFIPAYLVFQWGLGRARRIWAARRSRTGS